MYSIGQVAEMFGLPISTLRYYDKQGLFPNMERVSGIRKFSEAEIEALRVCSCLSITRCLPASNAMATVKPCGARWYC